MIQTLKKNSTSFERTGKDNMVSRDTGIPHCANKFKYNLKPTYFNRLTGNL